MVTPTQIYTMVVHDAEEGGYWAEILELPGCATQGETLDELKANMREALEAVLERQTDGLRVAIAGPSESHVAPVPTTWTGVPE